MIDLQIIIPKSPSAYEIVIKSHYEIWKQEKQAAEPQFVIENIRFEHDPHWRERIFSVSAIRDVQKGECQALGPTIVWNAARAAFVMAAVGPYLVRML